MLQDRPFKNDSFVNTNLSNTNIKGFSRLVLASVKQQKIYDKIYQHFHILVLRPKVVMQLPISSPQCAFLGRKF